MKITPLDIQQQQFKGKTFGGLDPDDVDTFLQLVASEMENLVRDNTDLKEQLRRANMEVEAMREKEKDLRETMLAAQKITEEMKVNSQKEAALIVADAELKAQKLLADADRRLVELNSQVQDMRRAKLQFQTSMKALLDSHYKMIISADDDNERPGA